MIDFDELRSPKAILGIRQINGEQGGATVHCVVLADGFIIEAPPLSRWILTRTHLPSNRAQRLTGPRHDQR